MFYETSLTIPKNTPESAPVVDTIPVHPGVVKRVEVLFPDGCVGLVHVRILYYERQLWPANPDSSFKGDGDKIAFDEDLELTGAPFEFTVEGWNMDDTYQHTPIVRLSVIPFERDLGKIIQSALFGGSAPVSYTEG
jgi:hypothetical protein